MKKNGVNLRFIIAVAFATFVAFSVPVVAQPGYQPSTNARLKVQHVRSAMMFWWLTGKKGKQEKNLDGQDNGFAKSLPGLHKLAFDAAANELIASGAPEGIEALREVLRFLDRPIRKIEVQVQAIELDEAYADKGKWFGEPQKVSIHDKEQFHLLLEEARKQGHAKSIQTLRVELLNNSKSKIAMEESALLPAWELAMTPTLQNDDTVTIFCTPGVSSPTPQFITTVANLRQGDVMLLKSGMLEQTGRIFLLATTIRWVEPKTD